MENMSEIPQQISSFRIGSCIYRTTLFATGKFYRPLTVSRISKGANDTQVSAILSGRERNRVNILSICPLEVVTPGQRYLLPDSGKLFFEMYPYSWAHGTPFRQSLFRLGNIHNDLGINLFNQITSVQFDDSPFARSFGIKFAMLLVGEKHLTGPDEETEYPGTTVKFLFSRNLIRSSNEADLAVKIFQSFGLPKRAG